MMPRVVGGAAETAVMAAGENDVARPHRYRQVVLCRRASRKVKECQAESL